MKFIPHVERARFDDFVRLHPTKSHFMQSAAWGDFSRVEKALLPHMVGLEGNDGKLVAAALLLERKPPMFPKYFYCPRGPVVDFDNRALLFQFLGALRDFSRSEGAMFLKFDPDVPLRVMDGDGTAIPDSGDNSALVTELKAFGCVHRGFNTGFEGRQPRYTFRIDLSPSDKEIDSHIVGNVLKNVKKSHRYACEVARGVSSDIPELHRLISITSERDDFIGYGESYYQNFYDILAKNDMATLWLGKVDPARSAEMLRGELEALLEKRKTLRKEGPLHESELSEQRLLREIENFNNYALEYPDGATISAHLVARYGDKAWAVHAGSDRLMSETFTNNRVYYEKIHAAKADGARLLDQFGTVGNPESSPLKSLHEFKRQFGGRYIEFIGEFDIVLRPFWHFIYDQVLPLYRRARISLKMARRNGRQ
ncbi:MAG: peptidoglycan bridge formation glycyltransferase FemA/FemB family protein [Oscillospiraceae bacterium]